MDTPQEPASEGESPSARTDEIRQAAARLFEANGYSSTTITEIANAVGILPGSLYYHFASKEDVALDIVADFERDAAELASTLSADPDASNANDARAKLTQAAEAIAEFSARNRAALRLTAYAAPDTATERFGRARESAAASLSRVWKRLVEDLAPDTAADDVQDAGLLRFALANLTLNTSLNMTETDHPRSVAGLHVAMLLDGIATDSPGDDELERSEAMVAAREVIAGWGPLEEPTEPNSRERIVASARTEFARRGFDATTVRDIAKAAQVRMATLYRRVNSKEELLGDILGGYDNHFDAAVRAALTTGDSAVESLDAVLFVLVSAKRRFRLESEIVKLTNPWTAPESPALKTYWASTGARLRLLESALANGMKAGSIRPLDAPAEIGTQIRYISWVPYQDYARASPERTHRFLRNSLLRGFLSPR